MDKQKITDKIVAIRYMMMMMTMVPIFLVYVLPNISWILIIKAILVFWFLSTIYSAFFTPRWYAYQNLGMFLVLNSLLFITSLWISNPIWLKYVFSFILAGNIFVAFKDISDLEKK